MIKRALRSTISQLFFGLLLGVSSIAGYEALQAWLRDSTPLDQIFEAKVQVPDFIVGQDPAVLYSRTIYQDFVGDYTVEVKTPGKLTVCRGAGDGILYSKGEALDTRVVTLSWYVDNPCAKKLAVGSYYLETTYTIHLPGQLRYLTTVSNIFNVLAETK